MIDYKNPNFFNQILKVEEIKIDRTHFFIEKFKNKNILHVGCADYMAYDPLSNLHIKLLNSGLNVDGYDLNSESLNILKKDAKKGNYYSHLDEFNDITYDLVLIPEVLEHVDNAKLFLDDMFSIKSKCYFITVPNCEIYSKNMFYDNEYFHELVHPDHKYWFSAYTLFNICKKYIINNDANLYYLEGRSMIAIEIFR